MIKVNVLTLFPNLYIPLKEETIVKKAIDKKELSINIIDIRDYTTNKHKKVDDYVYGGGEGMLMQVAPIDEAIIQNNLSKSRLLYTSPKGKIIKQDLLYELSQEKEITILVGRYEGVDERIFSLYEFEEVSIGDFILTGGDLVAQVLIDGISRLLPNVLNNKNSYLNDSFTQELLEHPQYTRPEEYKGLKVPEILLSGHHQNIEEWKKKEQIKETKQKRPDMYLDYLEKTEKENN